MYVHTPRAHVTKVSPSQSQTELMNWYTKELLNYMSTLLVNISEYNIKYRITGYFRSRNFRITHAKLNFKGFIFVHFQLQDNLSIRDLLSKSFIFEGVTLFEIFENKTPSKITRYTVLRYTPVTYDIIICIMLLFIFSFALN